MKIFFNHIVSIIIWLSFFSSIATFSQTDYPKIDSLNLLAYDLTFSNIDSAFILAERAKELSIISEYLNGIAEANCTIGTSYFLIEKIDSALIYLYKAVNISKTTNFKYILALAYNILGIIHYDTELYTKSIDFYHSSLEINKETKDSSGMCFNYSNIGRVFASLGDYKKEMEYLIKGYEISKHMNKSEAHAYNLECIGNNYTITKKFKKASAYLTNAMSIMKELNIKENVANINNDFADLYFEQNNFDLALEYINKTISGYKDIGNTSYMLFAIVTKIEILEKLNVYDKAILLVNKLLEDYSEQLNFKLEAEIKYLKGKLNYNLKRYLKAKNSLQSVLILSKSNDNLSTFRNTYEILYKIAIIENDPKETFKQYKYFAALRDSVNILETKARSMDFEKLRELNIKEKEIEDFKKNKIIADLEISSQKSFRNFLYITFVLLGIIIIIIAINNFRVRRINSKLKLLNESEERFLKVISHDTKNSLSAVINFSNMLINDKYLLTEKETDDSIAEINKAALATNNLLSNLLQWTLAKKNDFSFNPKDENLKKIIEEGIVSSQSLITIKELELTISVDDEIFVFIDSNSITSVIRNLLTNAIKFSNSGGKITFSANIKGNFVEFVLIDNGIGMDVATVNTLFNDFHSTTKGTNNERGTGIGISLIKKFVETNGGTIKVKSKLGKGSTFSFTMPKGKNNSNNNNHLVDLPNKNKKASNTEKIRTIAKYGLTPKTVSKSPKNKLTKPTNIA